MNKKPNILITAMTVIGVITTAVVLCIVFRDRIKETYLYQRFFAENDDDDMDLFEEDFPEEEDPEEEGKEEEDVEEEEEEKPATKARRGYTALKVS